ncbi:MAG: FUSC family protein, partial [Dysgonamonadaceae bacterium]|nr:FUSC family protein [Dysgonamonadaceae bacterium]
MNTIKESINSFWINVFWKNPNHLWALKVTVSIAFLLIPAELLFHNSFIGTTMSLGVVAMALGETDVHPKGRIKSAVTAIILFFITSSLVELLLPFPTYFAVYIFIAAFS